MKINLIADLASLPDEPILSNENDRILKRITSITRTSQFELLNLDDEKLDELTLCLKEQEDFTNEITSITRGLERAPSIILWEANEEEDYI